MKMITIKHDGCIFCVGCSSVCPMSAIEAVGTRMKHYPEKCTDCGLCVKICPANVICMYKGVKSEDKLPPEAKI
jgi:formate hydrogenlyase subunit 6/NADH:ubiquinone oxidoreductase subunit I